MVSRESHWIVELLWSSLIYLESTLVLPSMCDMDLTLTESRNSCRIARATLVLDLRDVLFWNKHFLEVLWCPGWLLCGLSLELATGKWVVDVDRLLGRWEVNRGVSPEDMFANWKGQVEETQDSFQLSYRYWICGKPTCISLRIPN